jgi:DNA-binding NtrC family response regulator
MTNRTLHQCRVLVVEDEYMLAEALEMELLDVEALVLGPVGTIEEAMALIRTEQEIDGVILDVNLHGKMTFPVADLLVERGVPFVFTTGYDASMIPGHLQHIERCEKPVSVGRVTQAIGRLIHP